MTGLILVGLLPFAALGIALGHMLNVDSIGPAIGGGVSLFAFLGGTWFPITTGFLHDVGQLVAVLVAGPGEPHRLGGQAWGAKGWVVVAVWTVVCAGLARYAYRRDTARV